VNGNGRGATSAWCAACGAQRPREELTAFWPIERLGFIRYVCRPIGSGRFGVPCFAKVVGDAARVAIAPAWDISEYHEQEANR
jgi:hypothetical protein